MKKMSKNARSMWLNVLLITGTILIVLYLGGRNGDLRHAWLALVSADPAWIACAFGSCLIFILFETLVLHVFFRMQHIPVRFSASLLATLIGMFYSNITPAATGGQPMQMLCLGKRGVPSGQSASALTVKFFCFQTSLLLLAGALWLCYPQLVHTHTGAERWFIYVGFAVNLLAVLCVLLLAVNKRWITGMAHGLIRLGAKLRILRNADKAQGKIDRVLGDFHASVDMIRHHPLQLMLLMLLSCVQILGLMSVIYCVYRAMGLSEMGYLPLLTLQFLLFIGAAFTPLPGSSGAQEGGFYLIFRSVFPGDKLLGALLLWRFFTYYLTLIAGLGSVIADSARTMRGKIRKIPPHSTLPKEADMP